MGLQSVAVSLQALELSGEWGTFLAVSLVTIATGGVLVFAAEPVAGFLTKGTGEGPAVPSRSVLDVTFALVGVVLVVRSIKEFGMDWMFNRPHMQEDIGIFGLLSAFEGTRNDVGVFGPITLTPILSLVIGLALFLGSRGLGRLLDHGRSFAVSDTAPRPLSEARQVDASLLACFCSIYGVWIVASAVPVAGQWAMDGLGLMRSYGVERAAVQAAYLIAGIGLVLGGDKVANLWGWLHADREPAAV